MATRLLHLSPRSGIVAVFVAALCVRIAVVIRSGGYLGDFGYDPGVYYAGGDALIHGRLPYRDFVFLHPPVMLFVAAPFALLGHLTSDHLGFAAANIGFAFLGALNASLVTMVGRRLGLSHRAALIGGGFYAVWLAAGGAEYLIRLEPLGNTALLAGLLVLLRPGARSSLPAMSGAGALLALAAEVKIWFAAPFILVAVWAARATAAVPCSRCWRVRRQRRSWWTRRSPSWPDAACSRWW